MEIGILGGGIAGLGVALALRKQGYSPRVYERRAVPATMGAGVTLWPNASFVLQELGLLQDIGTCGGRPPTMRRHDAAGNALGGLDIGLLDRTMGYPTYTVLRRDLQQVLLDHVARAGIPVEFGRQAVAIELDAHGKAVAHFENGESIRPDLLIGADGRMASVARKFVAGDNTPVYQGFVNWIGVAQGRHALVDDMSIQDFWGTGDRFGCVAIRPDLVYWAAAQVRPLHEAKPTADMRKQVENLFAQWPEPVPGIIRATPDHAIRLIAVHDLEPLHTWSRCIRGAGRMYCWLGMPRTHLCRHRDREPARRWRMRGIWLDAWMVQVQAWKRRSRHLQEFAHPRLQGWRNRAGSSHAGCSPRTRKPAASATRGPGRQTLRVTCRPWHPDGGRACRCLVALTARQWRKAALAACTAWSDSTATSGPSALSALHWRKCLTATGFLPQHRWTFRNLPKRYPMAEQATQDRQPQPDPAEFNAFFPSRYSLSQFTSPKSDLKDADYATTYQGSKKILMIGADERYLLTDNGSFFSTGNHPVETLLPMYHLDKAGFAFDVATVSGNPVKFEFWAMPSEDETVKGFFDKYHPQFKQPLRLSSVLAQGLEQYAAIFVPGGHGALIGLPDSRDVGAVLEWAAANNRFVISLCHGPAAFLAVGESDIYRGYKICAFPDALDAQTPDIGYMPGHLTWKFGERLKALGIEIVNDGISGAVHRDRQLITGDSPLAGNALGKLAAKTLLAEVAA